LVNAIRLRRQRARRQAIRQRLRGLGLERERQDRRLAAGQLERRLVIRVARPARGERLGRDRLGAAVHARVDLADGLALLGALLDRVADADHVALVIGGRHDHHVERAPLGIAVAHRDREPRIAGPRRVRRAADDGDEVVARIRRVVGEHPVDAFAADPLAVDEIRAIQDRRRRVGADVGRLGRRVIVVAELQGFMLVGLVVGDLRGQ
jgi:hypothetical protein